MAIGITGIAAVLIAVASGAYGTTNAIDYFSADDTSTITVEEEAMVIGAVEAAESAGASFSLAKTRTVIQMGDLNGSLQWDVNSQVLSSDGAVGFVSQQFSQSVTVYSGGQTNPSTVDPSDVCIELGRVLGADASAIKHVSMASNLTVADGGC